MHRVEPEIFLVAETQLDYVEVGKYLESIDAAGWITDAPSDVEEIIEIMGRGCYNSFLPGNNPNVTRVRTGNKEYLQHILDVDHGSVLEHGWVSFLFTNVSRVFTHELVRHRVGTAISQESLRYVRLDDLGYWVPDCFKDNPKAVDLLEYSFLTSERDYKELLKIAAEKEGVHSFDELPFGKKKEYTSAARRVIPMGTATNIGWSCNMRTLQHVINLRTDPSAEEEILMVFRKVQEIAQERWPNLFHA